MDAATQAAKDRALAFWTDQTNFDYNADFYWEKVPVMPLVNSGVVGAVVAMSFMGVI